MSVGALITWPYKAGGRSRRGSPKAGTTLLVITSLHGLTKAYFMRTTLPTIVTVLSSRFFHPLFHSHNPVAYESRDAEEAVEPELWWVSRREEPTSLACFSLCVIPTVAYESRHAEEAVESELWRLSGGEEPTSPPCSPLIHSLSFLQLPTSLGMLKKLWNLSFGGCPVERNLQALLGQKAKKTNAVLGYLKSVKEE